MASVSDDPELCELSTLSFSTSKCLSLHIKSFCAALCGLFVVFLHWVLFTFHIFHFTSSLFELSCHVFFSLITVISFSCTLLFCPPMCLSLCVPLTSCQFSSTCYLVLTLFQPFLHCSCGCVSCWFVDFGFLAFWLPSGSALSFLHWLVFYTSVTASS